MHRSFRTIKREWWDLVVLADHMSPFHPSVNTMLVRHGLSRSSKVIAGDEYSYGHKLILRPDGSPAYSLILEQSEQVSRDVTARYPQLKDRVVAVGDIRTDRVLSYHLRTSELRAELGFEETEQVILLMSTFGEASLMERMGVELLDEAERLAATGLYRFVITTHPNLWSSNGAGQPWDQLLRSRRGSRLVVLEPDDDWAPMVAAADVAISDHTSLSVGFALTGKPVVFIPTPSAVIMEGSPVWRLQQVSRQLRRPADLATALSSIPKGAENPQALEIAREYISFPGEAEARIRASVYSLLSLEESSG